jgi:hypothetical protein
MAVFSMAKAKLYIGTTAAADDLTSYEADTYAQIKEVQTISALNDTQNFTGFTSLEDTRTRQFKTTIAGENITVTCGYDPKDTGQIALRAAAKVTTPSMYNFKLEYNDHASSPTTVYWSGYVGNDPLPGGGNDDIGTVEFILTNNTGFVVEVRA